MSTFEDLIQEVKNGNTQKVEEIVNSGVNINTKGRNGLTPLCSAISKGNDEMVKKLLDLGADITQNCALFSTSEHNSDDKAYEISSTPIFLALDRHRTNIIEMFLNTAKERGLNDYINFQRPFDEATILMVSVYRANDYTRTWLVEPLNSSDSVIYLNSDIFKIFINYIKILNVCLF